MSNMASPGSGGLELIKRIEALEQKNIESLFKIINTTIQYTIAANGYFQTVPNFPTLEGYQVAGIIGYNTTAAAVLPFGLNENYIGLKNISSEALTNITMNLTLLYIKNSV